MPAAGVAEHLAQATSRAERALGAPVVAFARLTRIDDAATARVGVVRDHVVVGADGEGDSVDEALITATGRVIDGLVRAPSLVPRLNRHAPVGDVLIDIWRIRGRWSQTPEDFNALGEQRFYYHLSDEEALARAELDGRPFFLYGARGSRELRVLIRLANAWYLVRDVERPLWRLASGSVGHVDVDLVPAAANRSASRSIRLDERHVFSVPTLADAFRVFATRGVPVAHVRITELDRVLVFIQDATDWTWVCGYELDAYRVHRDTGPFGVPVWACERSETPAKHDRISRILSCPSCKGPLLVVDATARCSRCSRSFPIRDGVFDFMGDEAVAPSTGESEVSRNTPSLQLIHDLRLHREGLVLNAGAGDTPLSEPQLVNLEIVKYPRTDVVADGQSLPFGDAVFDMVFSQSVVEHVPDPFRYVRELVRVLKPGGTLLVDAPFVAPYHGFPDHYFNPTRSGLRVLCRGVEEIEVREGSHHDPVLALLAILGSFVGLVRDEGARDELLKTPIGEFIDLMQTGRKPSITRDTDPARTFEISAGFRFYGRKPGG